MIRTSSKTVLETEELSENNLYLKSPKILHKFVRIPFFLFNLIKYFQYPSFWPLTLCGPIDHNIDLASEFLLGTEIAHVWEENESLVNSIGGSKVAIRGSYKISVKTGHPVWMKRQQAIRRSFNMLKLILPSREWRIIDIINM